MSNAETGRSKSDPLVVFNEILGSDVNTLGILRDLPDLNHKRSMINAKLKTAIKDEITELRTQERILEEIKGRWGSRIKTIETEVSEHDINIRARQEALEQQVTDGFQTGALGVDTVIYARGLLEGFSFEDGFNLEEAAEELAIFKKLQPGAQILLYSWWPTDESRNIRIHGGGILDAGPVVEIVPQYNESFYNLDVIFSFNNGKMDRRHAKEVLGGGKHLGRNVALDEDEIFRIVSAWAEHAIDFFTPRFNKRTKQNESPYPFFAISTLTILDRLPLSLPRYAEAKALILELAEQRLKADPTDTLMLKALPDIRALATSV